VTAAALPEPRRLHPSNLQTLPAQVRRPAYHPPAHGVGIVHVGIGAFHRAHQAVYVDELLASQGGDWRIVGISCRSSAVRDQLAPQASLYTLRGLGADEETYRIIGSLADVLVAPENPRAASEIMQQPSIHIISLTITEKGYCRDPATGHLDTSHPDIVHDLAHPEYPRSALGLVLRALRERRRRGAPPPTLLCCDNLPENGRTLQRVLSEFAASTDPGFARWIEREVACPSTMVDRMVPATTPADIEQAASILGRVDRALVKAESFSQWVMEDRFAGHRPNFENIGVQVVTDVRPHEIAKLRLLNGSHSMLAYLGTLAGYTYVHEAVADPDFFLLLRRFMQREVAATLDPVPGLDVAAYQDALLARFSNHHLNHRLQQIAMDGSQKLPQRLLDTARVRLKRAQPIDALALAVAAWMRYATGRDEQGLGYVVDDPLAARFAAIAAAGSDAGSIADGFLALGEVFGTDLAQQPAFRNAVTHHLRSLMELGARMTVHRMVQRPQC
jgi:fructuronate reductase